MILLLWEWHTSVEVVLLRIAGNQPPRAVLHYMDKSMCPFNEQVWLLQYFLMRSVLQ